MVEPFMTGPVVQYGFVGLAPVLLGIIVWLIRRLLGVLEANSRVIVANTEAIIDLTAMTADLLKLNRDVRDKLISRPCIAKGERA